MSLTEPQIAAMNPVELLIRCSLKLGIRSHATATWNGTIAFNEYLDLIQWILRPILGDVNPRYAVCDQATTDVISEWALMDAAILNSSSPVADYATPWDGLRTSLLAWSGLSA